MFVAWLAYALLVSLLIALGVKGIEGALFRLGRPTRWAWVVGLVLLPLLVLAPFLSQPQPATSGERTAGSEVQLGAIEVVQGMGSRAVEVMPAVSSSLGAERMDRLGSYGLALWVALSLLLLIRVGLGFRDLRSARRRWPRVHLPEGEVHLSEDVGPGVFGVLRTGVVLPRWCLELESLDRSLILAHEEEHRQSRDTLLVALGALTVVVLPWNPVAWWMWHRLRSAVEVDCDQRVTRARPGDRRRYGRLLLHVGARRGGLPMPLATFSQHPKTLSRRIHMLTRPSHRLDLPRGLLLAALGIIVIAVACIIPGPDRTDGLVDPLQESETEAELEAADVAAAPQFTPHDEAPRMRDQAALARALERAYPANYRDNGIGATVLLHIFIDEEGTVRNAEVAESSGHQGLDEAALSVTDVMDFEPALNRGEAVPVWVQIPITFNAREGDAASPASDPEARRTEARAPDLDTPEDGPHFTPHDQAPRIVNQSEVSRLLSEAHPSELREAGIGGTVLLHTFIDENGVVLDAEVAEGSGHEGLDQAGLDVAYDFEYEPARNRGETVPVWVQVPVTFTAN